MNRIYFNSHSAVQRPAYESLEIEHIVPSGSVVLPESEGQFGLVTDEGKVIGQARKNGIALVILGWINTIPDNHYCQSTLDDPNANASELIDRYIHHGTNFLDGIEGSFVIVLEDIKNQRVVLGRDPSGGRRIFYSLKNGHFYAASHIVDFNWLLEGENSLHKSKENFLLAYEFLPGDETLYSDVECLATGHVLIWQKRAAKTRLQKIAPPATQLPEFEGYDEVKLSGLLYETMTSVLESQSPSTQEVGVLLGGFDSALIASLLVQMGKKVTAFTFQYPLAEYNQAYIEELVETLGIDHQWVPITADVIESEISNYAYSFNQPASQAHYLICSKIACDTIRRQGILFCFTGDGCDGLFLGYPTVHMRSKLISFLSRFKVILSPLRLLSRSKTLEIRLGHPYRIARNVLRILSRPLPARAFISACALDDFSRGLLQKNPNAATTQSDEGIISDLAVATQEKSELKLAYLGKAQVGLNRTKLEGCSAAAGITLNSPFIHPKMASVAAMIPEEQLRQGTHSGANAIGKLALTKMAEAYNLLPSHIIHQQKMSPVTTMVDGWYQQELQTVIRAQLEILPFETNSKYLSSLFSNKASERMFRRFVGISRYTSNVLSILFTYASFNPARQANKNATQK